MTMQALLSSERIRNARTRIDPVFRGTPLLAEPALDRILGLTLSLKDETGNPIRSFKGRGTSLFVQEEAAPGDTLVAASAGNFGQGLAYAGARRGCRVIVFAATTANPLKIEAMQRLGAEVRLHGLDLDAAKGEARSFAAASGYRFVEDGASASIAEGAGTIAMEMTVQGQDLDAVFIPLGNGALATGMGCWFKAASPRTRVIAVAAEGAPCMAASWRAGRIVETPDVSTIADGIAVRVPVPFAVECMAGTLDEVVTVADDHILEAMRLLWRKTGRIVEPAGAAGLAGLLQRQEAFRGSRVATVLCGANVTDGQKNAWFPAEFASGRSGHARP